MARYESIYIKGKYPMPIRDTLFNQNKIENPTAEVTRPCDPLYGQQKIKVFLWFHIKLSEQQNKGMHWDDTGNNKDKNIFVHKNYTS